MTTVLDALLAEVDGERMAGTVTALAGARFAGRRTGSPGGDAARAWLGDRLRGLGAEPAAAPFSVRAVPEVYSAPEVSWSDGATIRRLRFGREVAVHLASADHSAVRRGALVIAGDDNPAGRWLVVPDGMIFLRRVRTWSRGGRDRRRDERLPQPCRHRRPRRPRDIGRGLPARGGDSRSDRHDFGPRATGGATRCSLNAAAPAMTRFSDPSTPSFPMDRSLS